MLSPNLVGIETFF